MRVTPKSLAANEFFVASEAKNPAISAAEWLRAHLRPPWSLRFCNAIFVPLRCRPSREVPKAPTRKVPKRVLRKVPVLNGVPRKGPKKCFGVRASVENSTGEGTRSTFSALSSGTPFGTGTFRSTLFGTFPGLALVWHFFRWSALS